MPDLGGQSPVPTTATASLGAPPADAPPKVKNPLDDSDQRVKEFDAKQQALSDKLESIRKDTNARNTKLEDYFAANKPPVYKPPAPYKPPQASSPIEVWGSLAMGFAMLASSFTKTPMITAMNAGAAVMNSFRQGDLDKAEFAYQQWKDANTQALEMARYQQEAYRTLMETVERRERNNVEMSRDAMADVRAQMSALASAFKDETMLKIGQERDIQMQKAEWDRRQHEIDMMHEQSEKLALGFEKIQTQIEGARAEADLKKDPDYQKMVASGDTVGALEKLAEANPSEKNLAALNTAKEKQRAEDERERKYEESAQGQAAQQFREWKASPEGQAATPDEQRRKEAEIYGSFTARGNRLYPPITPENKSFIAQEFASYGLPPPTDVQLGRQPDMLAAVEEAKKINPSYDPARYSLVKAARQKITTGKDADAIASYVRLDQHLDFFKGLVDQLSDGVDIKTLNGIAALWGKQTGNPQVTSYETALQLVGDEMVKAATGTGAAGALGDREEIKKNFDPSLSKDQLKANINAVQVLVGGALVSTLNKYRNVLTPKELTDAVGSDEVMEHFHVDPKTGKPIVEGAYDFGGKKFQVGAEGVTPKTPAAPAVSGFKRTATYQGRGIGVVGGKWVFEDGTPVPGQ
ncbi:MAG: hypothetical protein JO234_03530 [Hyphomicrobiales bacterium]|nr:hypothetical protein [Hyphomicrobiales bacterium]